MSSLRADLQLTGGVAPAPIDLVPDNPNPKSSGVGEKDPALLTRMQQRRVRRLIARLELNPTWEEKQYENTNAGRYHFNSSCNNCLQLPGNYLYEARKSD